MSIWTELKEAKEAYDAVIVDLKTSPHTKNIATYAEDRVELATELSKNEKMKAFKKELTDVAVQNPRVVVDFIVSLLFT